MAQAISEFATFGPDMVPTQPGAMGDTIGLGGPMGNSELAQLDADKSYYVEFSYKLDTSQLPGPMQFGIGGQGEWAVGATRTLKVDLSSTPP